MQRLWISEFSIKPIFRDQSTCSRIIIPLSQVILIQVASPLFPGKRYEDWQLEDPAGQDVAAVITIRDDIRARVEQLMASLEVSTEQVGS